MPVIFYHFTFPLLSYILVIILTKRTHQIYYCANGKQYFEKDNFNIQKFFDQLIRCFYLLFFIIFYVSLFLSKLFTFTCFCYENKFFFHTKSKFVDLLSELHLPERRFSERCLLECHFARIIIACTPINLNALLIWANVFQVKVSGGKNLI